MYTFREDRKGSSDGAGAGTLPGVEPAPRAQRVRKKRRPRDGGDFHPQVDGTALSSLLFDLDSQ